MHRAARANGDAASPEPGGRTYESKPSQHPDGGKGLLRHRLCGPLLLLLAVAALTLLSPLALSGRAAPQQAASIAAATQQMEARIKQLQDSQAQMLSLLKELRAPHSSNASSGTAAAAAPAAAAAATAAAAAPPPAAPATASSDGEQLPAAFAALPRLTRLHNRVLRRSHDFAQHRALAAQLLSRLARLPPAEAAAEVARVRSLPRAQLPQQPLAAFVHELYGLLLSSGRLVPCRDDSTLVIGDTSLVPPHRRYSSSSSSSSSSSDSNASSSSYNSSSGGGSDASPVRYFIATNLRDNSSQMPQFVLSLLRALLALPAGSAYVSVYESNSDDGAHGWVDVLSLALAVLGVPGSLQSRGGLVRLEGQHRIEFLAQVRNMALAPLYAHYAAKRAANGSSSSSTAGAAGPAGGLGSSALGWSPDYVVFVNDVFFCPSGLLRLLNHRADISCGTDWWQNSDATVALPQPLRSKAHAPKPQPPPELALEAAIAQPQGPDQTNPIVFYDIWVARDVGGDKFWWTHPFVTDTPSAEAVKKGLPFRASCCWNGLAVLAAAPFEAGVRFRSHMPGECAASECTLLCEDFARLGYSHVVVDAGVQLAYDWGLAREMAAVGIEGVGLSTWAQAKAAGVAAAAESPGHTAMECCSLRPGAKWINYYTDCSKVNILATNYTAQALAAGRRRRR